MKILIIGMPQSVHIARWVHQIEDQGWEIHLFPSTDVQWLNPQIEHVVFHQYIYFHQETRSRTVKMRGLRIPNTFGLGVYFTEFVKRMIQSHNPDFYAKRLRRLIEDLQPDVIHSIEFQHAGYLTLDALYKPLARPKTRSVLGATAARIVGEERLWNWLVGARDFVRKMKGLPPLAVVYEPSQAEIDRRKRRALRRSLRQVIVDSASSLFGEERLWRWLVGTRNGLRKLRGLPPLEAIYVPGPNTTRRRIRQLQDSGADIDRDTGLDVLAAASDRSNTATADVEDDPMPTVDEGASRGDAGTVAGLSHYSDTRLARTSAKWVVTSWGSDMYLFGRIPEHEHRLRAMLSRAQYFSCGCLREIALAEGLGFCGHILPVFASTGGFHASSVEGLRQGRPSERKTIILKGYQHFAGRALVGLRALERCANILNGYEIAIPMAIGDVLIAAEIFHHETGIPVRIVPHSEHREMLKLHGSARIAIGISISDGLPGFLLEAMAMGAFPIQSWTSCGDEWVEDGVNAFLVPPEDPDVIEAAIRRAVTDDRLVDRAAEMNWEIAKNRLDYDRIKNQTVAFYGEIRDVAPPANLS